MRRLVFLLLAIPMLFSCGKAEVDDKGLSIVAVNFPSYDAARAVLGNTEGLVMLLPPGTESHSYDPTPKDMVRIADSDLIIYTGGHSDAWVDSILSSISEPPLAFRLMDHAELLHEERKEGMEDEHDHEQDHGDEYDEHVWTSIDNEIRIINDLEETIASIVPERAEELRENSDEYIASLRSLDAEIEDIAEASSLDTLIFASRFPLLYFVHEYGIDYWAAFPGCAEETEPSARTVAFLIDKARELGVPCILNIEMSSSLIARTIAEDVGVPVRTFSSMHNVTKHDFDNGETYITIMKRNAEVLREALRAAD